jgi:hypothetical protein
MTDRTTLNYMRLAEWAAGKSEIISVLQPGYLPARRPIDTTLRVDEGSEEMPDCRRLVFGPDQHDHLIDYRANQKPRSQEMAKKAVSSRGTYPHTLAHIPTNGPLVL